ncbi:MAG: hypothetical protein HYZ81_16975 [Nitrospinae bacterium]|nr:hypothetical protein [Nitrospinota bacterium]
MGGGEFASPVYPVKVTVTVPVMYADNLTVRTDIFLFYNDAFNAWTFKTGSL